MTHFLAPLNELGRGLSELCRVTTTTLYTQDTSSESQLAAPNDTLTIPQAAAAFVS